MGVLFNDLASAIKFETERARKFGKFHSNLKIKPRKAEYDISRSNDTQFTNILKSV